MGAWGSGNFDNDDALDWLAELDGTDFVVKNALAVVAESARDARLTTGMCCCALAAAELVAARSGNPAAQIPSAAAEWAAQRSGADSSLQDLARVAVQRIEEKSGLQELFDEGGYNKEWHAVLDDLLQRLR